MLNIAHRGASGYEPENTIAAFEKAILLGSDGIELDIHISADNSLVVIHDKTLERTTNGVGDVASKTLKELKMLDAGKGQKIPTLEEVLDFIDKKAIINIELKAQGSAQLVVPIIEKHVREKNWTYDTLLVSSFNHHELNLIKQLQPKIHIAALVAELPMTYAKFGEDISAYSVHANAELVTQEFVDDAHNRDMKFFVYTVNEEDEIERMKTLGVDGIFTNYPDRVNISQDTLNSNN